MTNLIVIHLWTSSVANELSNYSSVVGRVFAGAMRAVAAGSHRNETTGNNQHSLHNNQSCLSGPSHSQSFLVVPPQMATPGKMQLTPHSQSQCCLCLSDDIHLPVSPSICRKLIKKKASDDFNPVSYLCIIIFNDMTVLFFLQCRWQRRKENVDPVTICSLVICPPYLSSHPKSVNTADRRVFLSIH